MNTHDRGRFGAVVAAVAAISAAGGTDALASAGCTAANSGSLNVDLSAGASVTRELALDAGDTLGITASGASATLISGAGAPLTLIAAGGATAGSLRAPQADTFALRFYAGADGPATIRISCTSAQSAAADAAFLARRNDLVKAQEPDRIRLDRSPTPIANADKPLRKRPSTSTRREDRGRWRSPSAYRDHRRRRAEAAAGPRRSLARRPHAELRGDRQPVSGPGDGNLGILYFGTRSMIGPDISSAHWRSSTAALRPPAMRRRKSRLLGGWPALISACGC